MKKILNIIIIFIFIINYSEAQEFPPLPSQNNFTGNPLSLNSGAVNIQIPLWESVQDGLSIPIYLSYSSNGIQVNATKKYVGKAWKLVVGGSLDIEQRGRFDLDSYGFPGGGHEIIQYPLDLDFLINAAEGEENDFIDTDPDIFHFNAPGLSGIFVFNNDGQVVPLTDKNLEISFSTRLLPIDFFKDIMITNASGIKYIFENTGFIEDSEGEQTSHFYALSKIEDLNNGALIQVNFSDSLISTDIRSYVMGKHTYQCDGDEASGYYSGASHLYYKRKLVESIKTNTSLVEFIYESDTYELISLNISLKKDGNFKLYKKYLFEYSGDFLEKISEEYNTFYKDDETVISFVKKDNGYTFDYTGSLLNDHDRYGYANGKTNTIDDLTSYDPDPSEIGHLKKITFPKGNYREYEYELNDYDAGLRVKSVTEYDEHDNQSSYTYYTYEGAILSAPADLSSNFDFTVVSGSNPVIGHLNSYSSVPFSLGNSFVTYSRVTEYIGGMNDQNEGNNGKVVYDFKNESSYIFTNPPDLDDLIDAEDRESDPDVFEVLYMDTFRRFEYNFPYELKYDRSDINGLTEKVAVYDSYGNILSETENVYDITENEVSTGFRIYDYFPQQACQEIEAMTKYYGMKFYKILGFKIKLDHTINRTFDKNDATSFTTNTTYFEYDENADGELMVNKPVRKTETLSSGDEVLTKYFYPYSFASNTPQVLNLMLSRNMKTPLIKKEVYKNGDLISADQTIFRIKTINQQDALVPDYIQKWEDNNFVTTQWFDKYDQDKGYLLQSHGIDGIKKSVLYGYDNSIPVANIINAGVDEVFYTSFEDGSGNYIDNVKTGKKAFSGSYNVNIPDTGGPFTISWWSWDQFWEYNEQEINSAAGSYTISGNIDEIRLFPKDALMTTLTFTPGIGITSQTDANGISMYNEYDVFGRLIKVYDQDKNLLMENEYHNSLEYFVYMTAETTNTYKSECDLVLKAVCSVNLEPANELFSYQWFRVDSQNDSTELNGDSVLIDNPPAGEYTYYLIVRSDFTSDQLFQKTVTILPGTLVAGSPNMIYFDYNGGSQTIDVSYDACDNEWDFRVTDDSTWTDYGWLTITKGNTGNSIDLLCAPTDVTETQSMQVNILNAEGLTDYSFVVERAGLPSLDVNLTYTVSTMGDFRPVHLVSEVQGGTTPYSYVWTVNGNTMTATGDEVNFMFAFPGNTYTFTCTVTDSSNQAVVSTASVTVTL